MQVRILSTPGDFKSYDQWVRSHPQGSLWQSLEWKKYQEALGRNVRIYVGEEGTQICSSALVSIDRTVLGFSIWDIPRGPLCAEAQNAECRMKNEECAQELLEVIVRDAKRDQCVSLYVSPPATLHSSLFTLHSSRLVMPSATRIIDLTQSDRELLARMKPKGRYNISVAQRHGVRIEHSSDIESFITLAKRTANRQGFRSVPETQYRSFLENLPVSFLLLARLEGVNSPISGLLGVVWPPDESERPRGLGSVLKGLPTVARRTPEEGQPPLPAGGYGRQPSAKVGTYYYGASDPVYSPKMAPYLLQWEAMKLCKSQGCTRYDLFGIAPPGSSGHPWERLSRFKKQFGGEVVSYPAEQEIRLKPMMTFMLKWKRKVLG